MRNSKPAQTALVLALMGLATVAGPGQQAMVTPRPVNSPAASVTAGVPNSQAQITAPAAGGAGQMAQDQMGQGAGMSAGMNDAPLIHIGAGDMVNVVVFQTPELSTSVRVNQDGQVNLPVLGVVSLAGMSANDAARTLEEAYKSRGILIDPHVTVFVAEYASQGASVMGEVRAPGVYPTLGTRHLLDMLSLAGGVSPSAGKVISIVHKDDPTHPVQIALQPTPASLHAQVNPVIQPGDTIVVAKSGVVYVIGDVLRPGGILVDNNERLSVIEALSLSGGMNKTAALSKTKLIRKLPTGREEIDLDLKHVLYGKQADVMVSDGDILYVPSSVGKTFLYRGIEAAIALSENYAVFSRE